MNRSLQNHSSFFLLLTAWHYYDSAPSCLIVFGHLVKFGRRFCLSASPLLLEGFGEKFSSTHDVGSGVDVRPAGVFAQTAAGGTSPEEDEYRHYRRAVAVLYISFNEDHHS